MAEVIMPQLGETVTEGTITRWLKKQGDPIAVDEILFEVSTDKVDSEVPSPAGGFLSNILVKEGETVPVGAVLAVVSDDLQASDSPKSSPPETFEQKSSPKVLDSANSVPKQNDSVSQPQQPPEPTQALPSSPKVEKSPTSNASATGRLMSPLVRQLLQEYDIDPSEVTPTGDGNRITRSDVLLLAESKAKGGTSRQKDEPSIVKEVKTVPETPYQKVEPIPISSHDEIIPFSNMRRRTAQHMVHSIATSAHTLVAIEVDFENIEKLRRKKGAQFKAEEGFSLTYLAFISLAVTQCLREFPHLNSSVNADSLVVHKDIHLGIAVDLNFEGLIVPVIHNADGKRVRALAREIVDLASRARSRRLGADDIAGGTFTITNPGPFGTFITVPVINQPQVAILSTDGIKRRPVVVQGPDGGEAIAIHSVGILALSFDHRAVDGAYASAFLARLKQIIETKDWDQEI